MLPPKLLSLVMFDAVVIRLQFDGYRIIWVDCGCSWWDAFCTPLIIASMSRLYLGLTSLVVTEAVVLVVFLFLLRRSFIACSLAGFSVYIVEYRRWFATILLSHITLWDCLCQQHFNFDFNLLCLVIRGLLDHPYRGLICLQISRLCLLLLLYQLSWPAISVHTFLMMAGLLGKGMIELLIGVWKLYRSYHCGYICRY